MSDMSVYGSSAANRLRITGMASGLDVEEAVKKMLTGDKIKVDKAKQAEQYLKWKQEEYREIIKSIKEFQDYFKIGSEKCINKEFFNPISVSTVNENVVKAKAAAGTIEGTYKVDVKQMAKGAKINGKSRNAQVAINELDNWKGETITFGTESITLSSTIDSKEKLVEEINNKISEKYNLSGKISVSYINESGKEYIKFNDLTGKGDMKVQGGGITTEMDIISPNKNTTLKELKFTGDAEGKGNIYLSYNGERIHIEVSKDDTVEDVVKDIYDKTSGNVIASFDEMTGSFSLSTKDTGSSARVSLEDTDDDLIKALGLSKAATIKGKSVNTQTDIGAINKDEWIDKKITFKITDKDDKEIKYSISFEDKDFNGIETLEQLKSLINKKISEDENLKEKINVSYIEDNNGKHLKFNDLTDETIKKVQIDSETTVTNAKIKDLSDANKEIISIKGNTKLSELGLLVDGASINFGASVNVTGINQNTTIDQFIDKINKDTSGKVIASFDELTGRFSFKAKDVGSDVSIEINSISDEGLKTALGLTEMVLPKTEQGIGSSSGTGLSLNGQDAKVEITGPGQSTPTITTQKSNEFIANGVSYDIKSIGETSITVDSDEQKVVDKIKVFVKDYNKLIEKLQKKLTEKKPKRGEFKPLTDEQKKAMSKEEIEKWEEKGKAGILRNDDMLGNMLAQLRGAFAFPVYDEYKGNNEDGKMSFYFGRYGENAVGLDMNSSYKLSGQLQINEEALLKAIKNNPEEVSNFFYKESALPVDTTKPYVNSDKYHEDGIFTRMKGIFDGYVGKAGLGEDGTFTLFGSMNIYVNKQYNFSISGSGGKNTISDQIYKQHVAMQNALKKMYAKEDKYYKQFSRLETAMNNLNAQSNYLAQQLGM